MVIKMVKYNLNTVQLQWLKAVRDLPVELIGKGRLRNPKTGAMCVLGVLCDEYIKQHPDKCWWDTQGRFHMRIYNPRTSKKGADWGFFSKELYTYVPPDEVLRWANVQFEIKYDNVIRTIPWIQDHAGLSNPRIARVIASALSSLPSNIN
jgi:hypothetical protein